jgi:phage shock protein PspC (stress-responsive transcriptional regulator)
MSKIIKRIYKSEKDKKVAGILGGLGDYFNVDPTLLRLGFLFLVFITGIIPGVIAYFVAALIVPKESEVKNG